MYVFIIRKGKQFRDYFVMLRKFIDYYRNHISDKILELMDSNKYIYILCIDKKKNIFKLGKTKNIRKRLYVYATGLKKHPDIKYILIVENPQDVENCVKLFTNRYRNNKEQYKISFDTLKQTVLNCAEIDKSLIDNPSDEENNIYLVYDDSKTIQYVDLDNNEIISYDSDSEIRESSKKLSKKSSKKLSKKSFKKSSKKLSRKLSKTSSKKTSKKSSKKSHKKISKK